MLPYEKGSYTEAYNLIITQILHTFLLKGRKESTDCILQLPTSSITYHNIFATDLLQLRRGDLFQINTVKTCVQTKQTFLQHATTALLQN